MLKKILCSSVLLFFYVFLWVTPLHAVENNKFGISLLQPTSEDIQDAAKLINGENGDWGYVTLVIQENDRDVRKWQDLFEQLRVAHLIPIVRLATSPQGEVWRRPEEKDVNNWVEFLNKLNWVVKKRYIVLFNEPNHASEWGGEVDPEGYAKISYKFAKAIKESNKDYVVMLAGLDAAAPSYPTQYEDSGIFIRKMFSVGDIELEKYIDAWASHSYPNPAFSGSVWDTGKKTVRGYEYELGLLSEIGVKKQLPVFITETGWIEGKVSEAQIADNYHVAFNQIWGRDDRVQAVTPFVFKYLAEPFIGFSWKKDSRNTLQYDAVKNLPKQAGEGEQEQKGTAVIHLPKTLIARSTYHFPVYLKNEGQAIWSEEEGYELLVNTDSEEVKTLASAIQQIRPFEEDKIGITIRTPSQPKTMKIALSLNKKGESIVSTKYHTITIEPFPELVIQTSVFPKFVANEDNLEVQLFNKEEEMVFSKKGLSLRKGKIFVDTVSDVIPGERYRVVLLGYPYIPRQSILTLSKGVNKVVIKRLLPFDADGNGKWDPNDIKSAVLNPAFFLRFIPWREGN